MDYKDIESEEENEQLNLEIDRLTKEKDDLVTQTKKLVAENK